jgi:hypothetical protein
MQKIAITDSICGLEEKAFARAFLVAALAILAAAISLQVITDPRGDFSPGLGVPEKFTTRFNVRKEKLALIENLRPNPPEAYILGSSRLMRMDPRIVKLFTGYDAFNFAVLDGMPEDFYIITRYLTEDLRAKPGIIILGVDEVAFRGRDDRPERTAEDAYDFYACPQLWKHLDKQDQPVPILLALKKIQATISREYLSDTITFISRKLSPRKTMKLCILDANGFTYYSQWDQRINLGLYNYEDEMKLYAAMWKERFEKYRTLSTARQKYLEKFFHLCRQNRIQLKVLITPMHKSLRESLKNNPNAAAVDAQMRSFLHEMQKKYSFELYDFSTPASFDGAEDDFYDGVHCKYYNNEKMLLKLFSPALKKCPK